MVNMKFGDWTEDGRRRYLVYAKNHATGKPELCAAISALIYTYAGYMASLETEGEVETVSALESGDAKVSVLADADKEARARAAYEMLLVGALQLFNTYGKEYMVVSVWPDSDYGTIAEKFFQKKLH